MATNTNKSAATNKNKSAGARGVSWRDKETRDLLAIWGEEKIQEALGTSHRNIDVFEQIAEQMVALGHNRTALECRTKTKAMRHEYKRVCAHNSRSGNSRATCPFYAELHRILGGDASLRPRRVARSLKLRYNLGKGTSTQQSSRGQEQLEAQGDLNTINMEDIATTSGVGGGSNFFDAPGDVDVSIQFDDYQTDPETQNEDADMEPGAVATEEEQTEEGVDEPGPGSTGNIGETDPAEQTAEERLATARQRRKKISVLNDVANQMLQQAEREGEATQARHRDLLQQEESMDSALRALIMQQAQLDREAFIGAMDRGFQAIESSTNAILLLGERLLAPEQPRQNRDIAPAPAQDVQPSTSRPVGGASGSCDQIPGGAPPSKKKRVVKKVKRMDM